MACPCTITYPISTASSSLVLAEQVRSDAKSVIAMLMVKAANEESVLNYTKAASLRRSASRLNLVSKAAVQSNELRAELIREAKELITLYGI